LKIIRPNFRRQTVPNFCPVVGYYYYKSFGRYSCSISCAIIVPVWVNERIGIYGDLDRRWSTPYKIIVQGGRGRSKARCSAKLISTSVTPKLRVPYTIGYDRDKKCPSVNPTDAQSSLVSVCVMAVAEVFVDSFYRKTKRLLPNNNRTVTRKQTQKVVPEFPFTQYPGMYLRVFATNKSVCNYRGFAARSFY